MLRPQLNQPNPETVKLKHIQTESVVTRANNITKKIDDSVTKIDTAHMIASKGYTCTVEICKGNACECRCKEQPWCENIGCDDQKEYRCMTKEECERYMTEYKDYTCNDESCKDNNCVCKYEDQPLYEDVQSAD